MKNVSKVKWRIRKSKKEEFTFELTFLVYNILVDRELLRTYHRSQVNNLSILLNSLRRYEIGNESSLWTRQDILLIWMTKESFSDSYFKYLSLIWALIWCLIKAPVLFTNHHQFKLHRSILDKRDAAEMVRVCKRTDYKGEKKGEPQAHRRRPCVSREEWTGVWLTLTMVDPFPESLSFSPVVGILSSWRPRLNCLPDMLFLWVRLLWCEVPETTRHLQSIEYPKNQGARQTETAWVGAKLNCCRLLLLSKNNKVTYKKTPWGSCLSRAPI